MTNDQCPMTKEIPMTNDEGRRGGRRWRVNEECREGRSAEADPTGWGDSLWTAVRMPQEKRPVRAPVQPRVPPRYGQVPNAPLMYQTPPRQRPLHQKVLRFIDQMNRDFVHTKVAAVLTFIFVII